MSDFFATSKFAIWKHKNFISRHFSDEIEVVTIVILIDKMAILGTEETAFIQMIVDRLLALWEPY